ncbi:twin-arginine translocase subunit TatC [Thermoproteota archaeon]
MNPKKNFLGHLDDLSKSLMKSMVAILIGVVASFAFAPKLFRIICLPYNNLLVDLGLAEATTTNYIKSLSPSETLLISLKLVFIMSLILAAPVILYQLWKFISPGLTTKERRSLWVVFCVSPFFFAAGAAFAYFVVFPLGVRFLWNYTIHMGAYPDWTVGYYVNFAIGFLCAFGVAFELPVVIVLLSKLRLVTPQALASKRRYAILIIFIVAAILTPPDVISQVLLGVPMIFLYELSILMSRLVYRGKL